MSPHSGCQETWPARSARKSSCVIAASRLHAPHRSQPTRSTKQGSRMKTLVICSGGLDSVSLAHIIAEEHQLTRLVSFDYGQRHSKELDFAAAAARRLEVPHHLIDMRTVGAALTGSALTDDIDVPDGHYAEETMRITVVPNRNAIMLTVAFGIAAANGDDAVATASSPLAAATPKPMASMIALRFGTTVMRIVSSA